MQTKNMFLSLSLQLALSSSSEYSLCCVTLGFVMDFKQLQVFSLMLLIGDVS